MGWGSLPAQSFIGQLNPLPEAEVNSVLADDTVKILAVMVSFKQDQDGTTFGNGKFGSIYTENYGNDILDPLPHDKPYFESHLQFVKNYFEKVSKGKLTIEYTVLPDTFSVSQTMRNYSPDPGSDDFTRLGDFSIEAWELADQLNPGFDFSAYDVFLIFHAGVGRDVSLPGSIGNERDLPSVYLSLNAFKEFYGESFNGISVSNGAFKITNSMIIPETESRELETISGKFLFEITINGLLCASVASHLGLPDLFDTETGLSAIGRFGLMDGQGIFAYLGTFPPEPSPWSKLRLGWAEAVTMDLKDADVSIVTNLAAAMGDTVILKIPINSTEYFLVENRIRDANKDGSKVTLSIGGNVITKTFLNDTTGYRSFDIDSLAGVILDVDEFDWAVPGEGIVIWHVDENVINEKIAENKVNTDKNRRGVDVEEADGVQDIGESFITIFGDEVIGEGTEEDFWYASNPAELYQNLFNKETRPDTKTNTGANSLITIKDFSEIDNRMRFKVEFGDSVVKPLFSKELPYPPNTFLDFTVLGGGPQYSFCLRDAEDIKIISSEGELIDSVNDFSNRKPAAIYSNEKLYLVGVIDSILQVQVFEGQNKFSGLANAGIRLTSPPVIRTQSNGENDILVGTEDGKILIYSLIFAPGSNPVLIETVDTGTEEGILQLTADDQYWAAITNAGVADQSYFIDALGNQVAFDRTQFSKLLLTKNYLGQYISILSSSNTIITIKNGEILLVKNLDGDVLSGIDLSLGDLKSDGENYLLYTTVPQINALNLSGSLADNFPYSLSEGLTFLGISLTADFEGDDKSEIITTTIDGRIFAIDGGMGKVLSGYPISCGAGFPKHILYNSNAKTNLAVLNDQNVLSAWSISSVEGKLYWSEEYGNPQNTSFLDAAENRNRINEFFPENRAYNYPNPVYEGTTKIRYYVSENSKINIKIFDLAGDFVAELNDDAQGGMDNETVWNVGDIQSGVYFARIEANSTSGKTEQTIIKIAVVK